MVYHDRDDRLKKKAGWGRLVARGIGILILVGAVEKIIWTPAELVIRILIGT